ncbi:MAG: hypothetical protein WD627_09760 [Actinomycetota bacterium]
MSAEEMLAAMVVRYGGCHSYCDSGKVVTRFIRQSRPSSRIKPFKTAFVRPGQFRFEFRSRHGDAEEDWDRYIIWARGSEARTWWDVSPGIERRDSLGLAVAGATGVSGRSSHTVPALLLPDQVGGRSLTDLREVQSLGDEQLDEVMCYRLTGRFAPRPVDEAREEESREDFIRKTGRAPEHSEESPPILWIDRESLLLRRLDEQTRLETYRTENVTSYEPAVDVAIADDELAFDPPPQEVA